MSRALLRLVVGDVVVDPRGSAGVAVVAGTTAVVGSPAAALVVTAGAVPGTAGLALYGLSGTVIAFTVVAAVAVLAPVAGLTVGVRRREHALWQVVGLSPATVRRVVLAQLLLAGGVGALAGVLLARPLVPAVVGWTLAGTDGLTGVRVHAGGAGAAGVVVAVVLVLVVVGGWRAAGAAARTEVVQLLRTPDPPAPRTGPLRWALALALLLMLLSVVWGLPGRVARSLDVGTPLLLVGPLVAGVLVALGPLIDGPLRRAWTALVPARWSPAWFLACAAAVHGAGRSSAVSAPLALAVALTGSLFAATGTVARAEGLSGGPSSRSVVLLLGGPLLLAAVGAAASVYTAGRIRDRQTALLLAAGASPATVLLAAAYEALVHVVTGTLLGGAGVLLTAMVAWWAVFPLDPGVRPVLGVPAVAVTAGLAAVTMLLATLAPTLRAVRRDPVRVLAAQ
ncbi:hypothetical protein [Kineococcus sp. SYSU DK003]|uniref:hypothetical protein n=1 Tax=Kineococcus sp. SYSU DK003 TaxID=3383124 RepID=UPI003D7EE14C